MRKRLLTLLLAAAMVFGMLPHSLLFSNAAELPHVHQAAFASGITLDGSLTEKNWLLHGKLTGSESAPTGTFDALWDADTLYLGIAYSGAESVTVTLGTKSLTVTIGETLSLAGDLASSAEAAKGTDSLEIQIPFSAFGFTLLDYSQTVAMSVTLDNGTAQASYTGLLGFIGSTRTNVGIQSGFFKTGCQVLKESNNGFENVPGGIHLYDLYKDTGNGNGRIYMTQSGLYTDATVTRWVEFDFHAASMPVEKVPTATDAGFSNFGFSFYMSHGVGTVASAGIVNTADGLRFQAGTKISTFYSVPIGKEVGDTFRLALGWTPDDVMLLYIDGQLIEAFDDAVIYPGSGNVSSGLYFSLWRRYSVATSSADDFDITLTNIATGTGGSAGVLDTMIAADLLGSNTATDNVIADLSLPATYDNGQLNPVPLTWSSSVPAVISADGKVTRDTLDTAVTLTATVTGTDVSKAFVLTVPKQTLEATILANSATLTLDGAITDNVWHQTKVFSASTETLSGSVSALWDSKNLYFGISHSGATKLELALGENIFTVDLSTGTVSGGTSATVKVGTNAAELVIPFSDLGSTPADYCKVFSSIQITLDDTVRLAKDPIDLVLIGSLVHDFGNISGSGTTPTSGKAVTFSIAQADANLKYWHKGTNLIDHAKDITLTQTLCFTSLPVIDGTLTNHTKDRYYFFMQDDTEAHTGDPTTAGAGPTLYGTIYNSDANGNLMLRLYNGKTDNSSPAAISLGKKLGDTFRLTTLWRANNTVLLYVDDIPVGSVSNYSYTAAMGNNDMVSFRYQGTGAAAEFKVSGIALITGEYSCIEDEITKTAIFGSTDLSNVTTNLTLPTVFNSPYLGAVALTWESSDPSVIDTDGTVSRPQGKAGADVQLKLSTGDKVLWVADVFVPALNQSTGATASTVTAAFSDTAITADGSISEAGWTLHSRVQSAGTTVGKFGAQWREDALYLAVNVGSQTSLSLVLNGKNVAVDLTSPAVTVDGATVTGASVGVSGAVAELCIPFTALGLSVKNYGVQIPITVNIGSGSFQGTLKLISADWAAAHNDTTNLKADVVGVTGTAVENFVGTEKTADGYHLYDLYNYEGGNTANIRVYAIYMNNTLRPTLYDRTTTTFVEFDFQANCLPVTTPSAATKWDPTIPCYGFTWNLTDQYEGDTSWNNVVSFGIFNTADGLKLAVLSMSGTHIFPLGKVEGDIFRIGTAWQPDGTAVIYIDGEKFVTVEKAERRLSAIGNGIVSFNTYRSRTEAAACREDGIDVYVMNLAVGKYYGDTLAQSLTFEDICGANTDAYAVTSDLNLPGTVSNNQLTAGQAVTWSSADTSVIDPTTGKVTQPAQGGKLVPLTATLEDGDSTTIDIYVKGVIPSGDVLIAENDRNPAVGAGIAVDAHSFTLDENNNSIIAALEQAQTVNVVALTDGDAYSRLNEDVLTLWVSQDNITYTQIENFKLLHKGSTWYLYDFSAEAKYVKVHCTHYDGNEADFIGAPSAMITAYCQAVFGDNDSAFETTVQHTLTNKTGADKRDDAWSISKTELGLDTLDSSLRVFLGTELLYHYVDGDSLVVRVPEVKSGASVTLDILSGNTSAMDISNKEYVYEVSYGAREMMINSGGYFITTRSDGVMVGMCNDAEGQLYRSFSYDGGRSWTEPEAIACCTGWFGGHGGFIESTHTDRLIYHGHYGAFDPNDIDGSTMVTRFIYSDDGGETWNRLSELETDANYILSYSDGLELSCYDGEGENVDFVLPLGSLYNSSGSMCTRVAYSTDGGNTWKTSDTKIVFHDDESIAGAESGLSESTIMERDDGVLVLIARCQAADSQNFARSYSYDHGITWTSPAELTDVYTVNTQPMMYRYDESELLLWSGNNILGGDTYQRTPISVAVSHDGMDTFVNIQDLYVKYSTQGLTRATRFQCTNPALRKWGEDTLVVNWTHHSTGNIMTTRIENFTDYFYRTKGAYDHFETATAKYEGWSTILGTAEVSTEKYSEGVRSMRIEDLSAAARSVPYMQSGTVSMAVYVADANAADLSVELQASHSPEYGKCSPLGFQADNGVITLLGSEESSGLTLKDGWNTVTFTLSLAEGKAYLSLNGSEAVEVPVNTDIGTYFTYVYVMNNGSTPIYLDEFLVQDADTEVIPEAPETKIVNNSITLEGNIDMNFYMTLSDEALRDENAYMQFTAEDGDTVKVPVSDAEKKIVDGQVRYVFSYGVSAKEMNDTVIAQFFYGDGQKTEEKPFSIRAYAEYILDDNTGAYSQELKAMVRAMLHYGAYAQMHFGHNTEDLANSELEAVDMTGITAATLSGFAGSGTASSGAQYIGNSLVLKSETTIRFFFQAEDGAVLSVTKDDEVLPLTQRDGMYYAAVENISAKDLDTPITLRVSCGDSSITVTASPLTYAYNVLNAEEGTYGQDLTDLVKAMYLYNDAANKYFK